MKRFLLFCFLVLASSLNVQSQGIPWVKTPVDTSYHRLAKENIDLRIDLEKYKSDTDRQLSGIDLHINSATYLLGFVALLGILLGLYLERKWRQIEGISLRIEENVRLARESQIAAQTASNDSSNSFEKALKAEERAEGFFNKIEANIEQVFRDLKRSEVQQILQEIVDTPSLVVTYQHILFSAELQGIDYIVIKNCYKIVLNEEELDEGLVKMYKSLLLHHFASKAVKDAEINKELFIDFYLPEHKGGRYRIKEYIREIVNAYIETNVDQRAYIRPFLYNYIHARFVANVTILVEACPDIAAAIHIYQHLQFNNRPDVVAQFKMSFLDHTISYFKVSKDSLPGLIYQDEVDALQQYSKRQSYPDTF
ncbi:hypothetical protein [Dyadobacter linearis]|nr:hypothetical protein [Dyadobacter sp. CECT 9623]